jgi:hypothetical protein
MCIMVVNVICHNVCTTVHILDNNLVYSTVVYSTDIQDACNQMQWNKDDVVQNTSRLKVTVNTTFGFSVINKRTLVYERHINYITI